MSTFVRLVSTHGTWHIQHSLKKTDHHTFTIQHPDYGEIGGYTLQSMNAALQKEIQNTFNLAVQSKYSWLISDLYFDLDEEIMDKLNNQQLKTLLLDFYHSLYTLLEQTSHIYTIPYYCCVMQTHHYLGAKQLGLLPLHYAQQMTQGDNDITLSFLMMIDDSSKIFYQHQQLERQAQQFISSVVH